MNESRIAASLLTLLASGGTLERAVTELPAFQAQIESAFDWIESNGQCTAAEIGSCARRLGELIRRKEEAVRNQDFELAADLRTEECAIAKSLGLRAKGETRIAILDVEEAMPRLSALLHETNCG